MGTRFPALIVLAALLPASATAQVLPAFFETPPGDLVAAAFAQPYGSALAAELTRQVGLSADASCLQQKSLDAEKLAAGARDILLRRGTRMLEILRATVDRAAWETRFAGLAGADAKAEWQRLRGDADVQQYLELDRPLQLATIADRIVETLDRYMLLQRIRLVGRVHPLASGNQALLDLYPSSDGMETFLDKHATPELTRYLELLEQSQEALADATDKAALVRLGPTQLMSGVDADLAALCIVKR